MNAVTPGQIVAQLALIAVLIGLNAFFVMVEFAAVASRRSRIDQMAADDNRGARVMQRWLTDSHSRDRLIAASQLGVTVVSLALGDLGERTFALILDPLFANDTLPGAINSLIRALPLTLSLVIVSSFHVVFGEQVPKVAALRGPEQAAALLSQPMRVFEWFTSPLVWLLDRAASAVVRVLGFEPTGAHSVLYSVEELKQIVRESEEGGVLAEQEREMLNAVFDIRDLVTRQVMIPRTEIKMIDADEPFEALIALAVNSPHTKIPVYETDADHVIGVVYIKELVKALANPREQRTIRSLTREVLLVPGGLPVENLLARFRSRRQQIAIVLDEFGGTAELVTLEDIIEEIVGDLTDQFETSEIPEVQRLKDGSALLDGLILITEVNDEFKLHIVDANYDTLGGHIMGQLERIPEVGDTVTEDGVTWRVEAMDGMRVERVTLLAAQPDTPPIPPANVPPAIKPFDDITAKPNSSPNAAPVANDVKENIPPTPKT